MEDFENIKFLKTGEGSVSLFWGHGWGQNHTGLAPLAQSFDQTGNSVIVDFPGFGGSPAPSEVWGTEEYADAMAKLIRAQTDTKIIWIGHSFGCRVGLQLAARHPDLIAGLFLIAAAGLPRKRPLLKKLYFKLRILTYKALKKLIPIQSFQEKLSQTFGSRDFLDAGVLKPIFVRVVNEDLSRIAETIKCPVTLVYGSEDSETPPEIGERLSGLIKNSQFHVLEGLDHYTILSTGKHKVIQKLNNFIKDIRVRSE